MDVAKIGMAADAVGRMSRLHHRYFQFFDVNRPVLLEAECVRDPRTLEATLKSEFTDSATSAFLEVADDAGGRREWFLGSSKGATGLLRRYADRLGFTLHTLSVAVWLRDLWRDSSAMLFDWSAQILERAELIHFNANDQHRNLYVQRLRNVFALCVAIELPLETLVPNPVLRWHCTSFSSDRPGPRLPEFGHLVQRASQRLTPRAAKLAQ